MQKLGLPQDQALNRVYPGHVGAQPQDWNVDTPQQGPTESGQPLPPVHALPDFLQGVPPAAYGTAASQFYQQKFAVPGQGRQSLQEKIAAAEKALGRPLNPHEKEILSGVSRNPLLEATQHQYIDQFGNPYYVDEQGTPTRQRMGPNGKPREPFMEKTQRLYQGQGDPLNGFYGQ